VGPHNTVFVKDIKIIGVLNITDLATAIAFQECFAQFKDKVAKIGEINREGYAKLLKTDLFTSKVSEVLGISAEGKTVWEYQDTEKLDTILEVFSKGVHRVLVHTKDGKLRMLSQSDVVNYLKHHLRDLGHIVEESVESLGLVDQKTKILTISMYESALVGYQRMYNMGWEFSALPVVDKTGDVVATLSTSDLRGLTKLYFPSLLLPVLDFVRQQRGGSRTTVWTQPSSPLSDVIHKVVWANVHRVWVIKNHKIFGVITLSDIICKFSPYDFKKAETTS